MNTAYSADQMFEVPGSRLRELTDRIAALTAELEKLRADRDYWKAAHREITAFYWGRPA